MTARRAIRHAARVLERRPGGETAKEFQMLETLNRILLAYLGILFMTRERAEEIFDGYMGRLQVPGGPGPRPGPHRRRDFVDELLDTAEKGREELAKFIRDQVEQSVQDMGLARQEDIHRLESKLDQLLASRQQT